MKGSKSIQSFSVFVRICVERPQLTSVGFCAIFPLVDNENLVAFLSETIIKNKAIEGENKNVKSNSEQSGFCDFE